VTTRLTAELNQIHVRLAGVDAPELAHFGRPAQPLSNDALTWLRNYILQRRVRAYIYKRDQYDRVVATVYVRRGLIRRDVGLQMLKQGLATVYEAKSGAEFGTLEHRYRRAEWWAKKKGKGMWAAKKADFESPRAYKTRMNSTDQAK
jgi:endonuclease YncB( thermonuclease family)